MVSSIKKNLVVPGSRVRLRDWDPDDTTGFNGGKEDAEIPISELRRKLDTLQERSL